MHQFRYLEDEDHHEDDYHDDNDKKPWGPVIGASFLIMLVTFSGLLLVGFVSCFQRLASANMDKESFWHRLHHQIIPSFASGALLATTVFLLIPEGFELLEGLHGSDIIEGYEDDGHEDEVGHNETATAESSHSTHEAHSKNGAAWRLGASLLGGFLFPILLGAIFPPPDISECEVCRERALQGESILSPAAQDRVLQDDDDDEDDGQEAATDQDYTNHEQPTMDLNCDDGECTHCHDHGQDDNEESNKKIMEEKKAVAEHPRNISLAASILLGDFCHNFCDGIFLGTAFLLCSKSIAWTLTATTIYHEIAQEIADFALLTHHCGLSIPHALAANFAAGISVMIGGVIVLSVSLSDRAVGAILCISAGVYIYIAASECIPRIQAARKNARDTFLFLTCFVVGAVPIGLVLLNHGHCYEGSDEEHADDHADEH